MILPFSGGHQRAPEFEPATRTERVFVFYSQIVINCRVTGCLRDTTCFHQLSDGAEPMTTVDIHCHTFNADDLPVYGFVQRVAGANGALGTAVAGLLDLLVQGAAPGFAHDMATLDALLGGRSGLELMDTVATTAPAFEQDVDLAMSQLQATHPDLLAQAGTALLDEADSADSGAESIGNWWQKARQVVRWVKLFGLSRLGLVAALVHDYHDELDLAVPLLVDLGTGLGDVAQTTARQQIELFEKLSRASMLGVLPGAGKARLHPFVGFDPLAQLRALRTGAIETPLDLVKTAVQEYGFIGVKVYPPMGWRPIDNVARPGLSTEDAAELDRIVAEFATWCADEHVPVTAHSAESMYADSTYDGFGSPADWLALLERHPELRLNLGHFGGESGNGWPEEIAGALTSYPHLYADVGNHRAGDAAQPDSYFAMLKAMYAANDKLADRLMYGSDWFMVAMQPGYEKFLREYQDNYTAAFDEEMASKFLGGNALSFLGFDDPANKNTLRLAARYKKFAPDRKPAWLATGTADSGGTP
jgi:predicted TIM-barrel fold metal-dependent hydrolase